MYMRHYSHQANCKHSGAQVATRENHLKPNKPAIFDTMPIIGRRTRLFSATLKEHEDAISSQIRGKRLLVYGGAGSIGREVVKQIFARQPAASIGAVFGPVLRALMTFS